jgi:hypothetical protein
MNMKSAINMMVGLLVALALSSALALDRDHASKKLTQEQQELMLILDTNRDGVISEAEAKQLPELAARFQQLDQARNGVLEVAEFARFEVTREHIQKVREDNPEEYPDQ